MKKLITLTFLTFFAIMLVAQIRLDVEGDAKIQGKLDIINGANNIFIGTSAGQNNTTGASNTFLGSLAGISNTASNNTFIGFQSGNKNTSGTSNTFIGLNTGFNNDANDNTFIGFQAGLTNSTGVSNTFLGSLAGVSNTASNNTFIGFQSGNKNTSGTSNTFIGLNTGFNNDANDNTFIGFQAGLTNSTGVSNTFLGSLAGVSNTASNNTFIGFQSGNKNTSGTSNTFIGLNTGFNNNANDNTFIGFQSGLANTMGTSNTFIGNLAGLNNTDGDNNTFIGNNSGQLTVGNNLNGAMAIGNEAKVNCDNCAVIGGTGANAVKVGIGTNTPTQPLDVVGNIKILGRLELGASTTNDVFIGIGAGANKTGNASGNTFIGKNAGNMATSAQENTLIGDKAGQKLTITGNPYTEPSSNSNTMIGSEAGLNTNLGAQNVFLGALTGNANTEGDFNTYLGTFAGFTATGSSNTFVGYNTQSLVGANTENSFALGSNTMVTAGNSGVLGNVGTQKVGSAVNWSSISDGRFKKKIREDVKGLDFILQLRPVTYQIQAEKLYHFSANEPTENARVASSKHSLAPTKMPIALKRALAEKSSITYSGFVAQEVEKAAKKAGFNFSGVVKPSNEKDPYGLRYAEFTVPLVKATQEQQAVIEDLKLENQTQQEELIAQRKAVRQLQKEMEEYKGLLEELIANKTTNPKTDNQTLILERKASLSQNQPNPFQQQTIVNYFIPNNVQTAKLQVMTVDGKILGNININSKGEGQTTIETATYPSGIYYYALVLDGQIFETKRMMLMK